jgi:aspartate aminotransferase
VAQAAALEAITGPQAAVEEMRVAFDRRRRSALAALRAIDGLDVPEPEGAFYLFPSVEGLLGREVAGRLISSSLELADLLLDEAKVAVVPGEGFGMPGAFRLSYALSDEDLAEGIGRIAEVLAR